MLFLLNCISDEYLNDENISLFVYNSHVDQHEANLLYNATNSRGKTFKLCISCCKELGKLEKQQKVIETFDSEKFMIFEIKSTFQPGNIKLKLIETNPKSCSHRLLFMLRANESHLLLQCNNYLSSQKTQDLLNIDTMPEDIVFTLHSSNWPGETLDWFHRKSNTGWPDLNLKNEIFHKGLYISSITQKLQSDIVEENLMWTYNFRLAEDELCRSFNAPQLYCLITLCLLLEQASSTANGTHDTSTTKYFLKSYHIRTLCFWCLSEDDLIWEPIHLIRNLKYLIKKLLKWIIDGNVPNYFLPKQNLLRHVSEADQQDIVERLDATYCNIRSAIERLSYIENSQNSEEQFNDMKVILPVIRDENVSHLFTKSIVSHCTDEDQSKNSAYCLQGMQDMVMLYLNLYIQSESSKDDCKLWTNQALSLHEKIKELERQETIQFRDNLKLALICRENRNNEMGIPGTTNPGNKSAFDKLTTENTGMNVCNSRVKLALYYIAIDQIELAIQHLTETQAYITAIQQSWADLSWLKPTPIQARNLSAKYISRLFQGWLTNNAAITNIQFHCLEYNMLPSLIEYEMISNISSTRQSSAHNQILEFNSQLNWVLQWSTPAFVPFVQFWCHHLKQDKSFEVIECIAKIEKQGELLWKDFEDAASTDGIESDLSLQRWAKSKGQDALSVDNMLAWCYLIMNNYHRAVTMLVSCHGGSSRNSFSYNFIQHVVGNVISE